MDPIDPLPSRSLGMSGDLTGCLPRACIEPALHLFHAGRGAPEHAVSHGPTPALQGVDVCASEDTVDVGTKVFL